MSNTELITKKLEAALEKCGIDFGISPFSRVTLKVKAGEKEPFVEVLNITAAVENNRIDNIDTIMEWTLMQRAFGAPEKTKQTLNYLLSDMANKHKMDVQDVALLIGTSGKTNQVAVFVQGKGKTLEEIDIEKLG